jgi:hypothetical protein
MAVPPCTFPPQLMSVGAARKRSTVSSAVPSSVYFCSAMSFSMVLRSSIRRCVTVHCRRSYSVSGAHCGTGTGRPSWSTATMMIRHVSLSVTPGSRGSAEATSTRMCIEVRPV